MKQVLVVFIGAIFILGCAKEKKDVQQKTIKTVKKSTVATKKKEKKIPTVVVDQDGVAVVSIVTSDKMKFNVKEFRVKANQKIKLTLTHTGKLDKKIMGHNVVILKKGVKVSRFAADAAAARQNDYIPVASNEVIAHTKMIGGGEATTIEFNAPESGVYDFICSFPAHYAMMKGKFIVE